MEWLIIYGIALHALVAAVPLALVAPVALFLLLGPALTFSGGRDRLLERFKAVPSRDPVMDGLRAIAAKLRRPGSKSAAP